MLDHYLTLGRSGLRVSPFCLGAMTFGEEWGFGCDVETSTRLLDAYLERGGNFIDTANIYTKGHAEAIIGDHLGRDPSKRDRVVIATKFMGNLFTGDPNGGGGGAKSVKAACEESLRRLRTDVIDLYWMHFWDRHTPIDETLRALDDLVRAGRIRYVGFSDTPAWKCAQAQCLSDVRHFTPIIALQIEYSLIERTVEHELLPMAREMGMGVTPWSPLKGGILTGKYTREGATDAKRSDWQTKHLDDRAFAIIDALVDIARDLDATPAQVALRWVQDQGGVESTIIGARTMAQLEDNLGALEIELGDDHRTRLDEASAIRPTFP